MSCYWLSTQRALKRLEAKVDRLTAIVERVLFMVSSPGKLSLVCLEETEMSKIKFGIVLPVRPADDTAWNEIASGVLMVTWGEEAIELATSKEQQLTEDRQVTDERFIVEQNTDVVVNFKYVDDAGNLGAETSAVFTVVDTVPPVTPEALGLVALEEVPDLE